MKVFTCKGFEGHWPVGTAAVVVSSDTESAASALNDALKQQGLPGGVNAGDLKELSTAEPQAIVLCNGDY